MSLGLEAVRYLCIFGIGVIVGRILTVVQVTLNYRNTRPFSSEDLTSFYRRRKNR